MGKKSIYCLDVPEIENLLSDQMLLLALGEESDGTGIFDKVKKDLFERMKVQKEENAVKYAARKIKHILERNSIGEPNSKETLKKSLTKMNEKIDIETFILNKISEFKGVEQIEDYDKAIRIYKDKSFFSTVVKEYENELFSLLENNSKLLDQLREKYFEMMVGGDVEENAFALS